jgi:Fe2+ transport system protein FeoA
MLHGFTDSGFSLPRMNGSDHTFTAARLTRIDTTAARELRALGLHRGASIRVVKQSPKLVVRQGAKEVTLSKRLSRAIEVRVKSAARYW